MSTYLQVQLNTLLHEAAATLRAAGLEQPRFEARALASPILGLSREAMVAEPAQPVAPEDARRFRAAVARRASREPFARIVGRREFWSLDFALSPETLVPRPETEGVVEAVLDSLPDRAAPISILDLGTGTGCILLALLSELPGAHGVGIDCVAGAVATANANAEQLDLSSRAAFRVGDWLAEVDAHFDVVVCNPPYIPEGDRTSLAPEVRDHDPARALFAGPDGLDAFRAILADMPRVLVPGGRAVFECGAGQPKKVSSLLTRAGFVNVEVRNDLAGIGRVVTALVDSPDSASNPRLKNVKKSVGKRGIPV